MELEAELAACQAKLNAAARLNAVCAAGGGPRLPPRLGRRNTIALGAALDRHLAAGGSSSSLRVSLSHVQEQLPAAQLQQQQGSAQQQAGLQGGPGGGVLTLARLSSMLGACLLLETATTAVGTGSLGENGQLQRSLSEAEGQVRRSGLGPRTARTAQPRPAASRPFRRQGRALKESWGRPAGPLARACLLVAAQVSLLDDGGGAGVGAAAAAAVSVALAKSWATAAGGGGQALPRLRRGGSGPWSRTVDSEASEGGAGGDAAGPAHAPARFKLMAAVPRSQARQTKLRVRGGCWFGAHCI